MKIVRHTIIIKFSKLIFIKQFCIIVILFPHIEKVQIHKNVKIKKKQDIRRKQEKTGDNIEKYKKTAMKTALHFTIKLYKIGTVG